MTAGVGEWGAHRSDARGSGTKSKLQYDTTFAAEGADRVVNVATEGVERDWNVEWFTSGRESLSIILGGGYLYPMVSACVVVIIKMFVNMMMLVNYVHAFVRHTTCVQ